MRSQRMRIPILLCIAVGSIGATCTTIPTTKDINLDDDGRLTPGARVAYEILPGAETRRRGSLLDLVTGKAPLQGARENGEPVRKAAFTLTVAGAYATVDGEDDIDIPSGRDVQLGGRIPGPTVVDTKVKNQRGYVALRPGGRFFDILSIEAILGVAVDNTELHLEAPGYDLRQEHLRAAFVSGGRLSVRPIPLFDLYGQFVFMTSRFGAVDAEAGVQLNLTPNLGVYGGYGVWDYGEESFKGSGSDADFKIRGPVVGAIVTF